MTTLNRISERIPHDSHRNFPEKQDGPHRKILGDLEFRWQFTPAHGQEEDVLDRQP